MGIFYTHAREVVNVEYPHQYHYLISTPTLEDPLEKGKANSQQNYPISAREINTHYTVKLLTKHGSN